MKLIITGGAGFIGSNFIRYMLEVHPDYELVCTDSLTYAGNLSNLSDLPCEPRFKFYKADICDRQAMRRIIGTETADILVNFAAESHVDRSIEAPRRFIETNVIGTQTLLDACLEAGNMRFHQISTDEVYGDLPLNRQDLSFTEDSPLRPGNPYSASKAAADMLALAYHRTYGMPVTVSRCSNNYGAYQFPEKLIPLMAVNAMEKKPLPIYGTGENLRDWIYVRDHCSAVDLIIHGGRAGEVYNVGGGCELTNIDVVRRICKSLGAPEELITHVDDRKGHDLRYSIDHTKISRELGWMPKTDFDVGLSATLEWYRTNEKWWRSILSGEYQNNNKKYRSYDR